MRSEAISDEDENVLSTVHCKGLIILIRGLPLSTYAERGRGVVGPNADVVSEDA